jgi:zinc/manganese transport system permease protein
MNSIELSILIPAFTAGIIVLLTHIPLGTEVLKRGIIFIDLAIAQIAGLGALVATLFFEQHAHESNLIVHVFSLLAALSGAGILTITEKKFPQIQEAIIGSLFIFSASLALMISSQHPHGNEHMKDLLAGQILFVSNAQIIVSAVISTLIIIVLILKRNVLSRTLFYMLFAVAITISVQLVGIYLVFAFLILPALAVKELNGRSKLGIAYIIGTLGLIGGLLVSIIYDVTTGPAIVCILFIITAISLVIQSKSTKL